MIRVAPAEGRTIKMLDGKRMPAAGGQVKETSRFWARRLACGDVVEVDDKGKPIAKKTEAAPAAAKGSAP